MGGHYDSIHVRSKDREAIRIALETIAREGDLKCFLGPTLDEWTSIYPNESAGGIAAALARAVPRPILLTTVYDDDLFSYSCYEAGKLLDQYSSDPDCFEEASAQERERLRGKPEILQPLLKSASKMAALRDLLRAEETDKEQRFVFESDRLEKFASFLGIHNAVTSYEYLMQGERDGIKGWKDFVHIPDRTAELSARKAAAAAVRGARRQLQRQGLLCAESLPPDKGRYKSEWRADIYTDCTRPGFLIRWWKRGGYPPRDPELFRLEPPWPAQAKPTPTASLPVTDNPPPSAFPAGCGPVWVIHPSGHSAATRRSQDHLGIVNLQSSKLEKTLVCNSGSILSACFSSDGKLLLCATTAGVLVFEWEQVLAATVTMPKTCFLVSPVPHPSGPDASYANYIYDLAFDEARNRVLFGGTEGRLRFLDLSNGSHGTLLDPPGRMAIIRLRLSRDRETVCYLCSPGPEEYQPWRVQVWNYRALANLAGLAW